MKLLVLVLASASRTTTISSNRVMPTFSNNGVMPTISDNVGESEKCQNYRLS